MITFNRIFCEPYQKTGVQSVAKKGLALGTKQKISVAKLKAVSNAKLLLGTETIEVKKGQAVLIKEEDLHNLIGKQIMECDGVDGQFIIIDLPYIVGLDD